VAGIGSSRFPQVKGSALLALDRDEMPEPAELAELRRMMRSVIRDLAGGELNAWMLSPRRFLTLAGTARAAKAPDDKDDIV
jgi:hypothetical protein